MKTRIREYRKLGKGKYMITNMSLGESLFLNILQILFIIFIRLPFSIILFVVTLPFRLVILLVISLFEKIFKRKN